MRAVQLALMLALDAMGPKSRAVWLGHHLSATLAVSALPAEAVGRGQRLTAKNRRDLSEAFETLAKALPPSRAGMETGWTVELDLPAAVALIRAHSRSFLEAAQQTGSFLYRGVGAGEVEAVNRPRAVSEVPDLLMQGIAEIGRDAQATDSGYYALRCLLPARLVDGTAPLKTAETTTASDMLRHIRPANAHIVVNDKQAAAVWGTACSVWPLGNSLQYSWLDNCSEWWDPRWEREGTRSSVLNGDREAFFWRDEEMLRRFLAAGLRVDAGLPEAIRRGHEILVHGGDFELEVAPDTLRVIHDAFVCIPDSADGALRSALRIRSPAG